MLEEVIRRAEGTKHKLQNTPDKGSQTNYLSLLDVLHAYDTLLKELSIPPEDDSFYYRFIIKISRYPDADWWGKLRRTKCFVSTEGGERKSPEIAPATSGALETLEFWGSQHLDTSSTGKVVEREKIVEGEDLVPKTSITSGIRGDEAEVSTPQFHRRPRKKRRGIKRRSKTQSSSRRSASQRPWTTGMSHGPHRGATTYVPIGFAQYGRLICHSRT